MKKYIAILIFSFLSFSAVGSDFTTEQEKRIRQTVQAYCTNLTAYCNDVYNVQAQDKILKLVSNRFNKVYDDLNEDYAELEFYQYLKKIQKDYQGGLRISFSPSVENAKLIRFKDTTVARISLSKRIQSKKTNKNVNNYFYVSVTNYKIINVMDKPVRNNRDMTPMQMWQKALELMEFKSAFDEKYREGVGYLQKSAEQNYPEAINSLGILYSGDWMLNIYYNPKKAKELFIKAGKLGITDAYYNLAVLYSKSPKEISKGDIWKNQEEAASWYLAGSELNNANCQYALSNYYFLYGTKKEKKEGVKWLQKSAKNGLQVAKDKLIKLGYN